MTAKFLRIAAVLLALLMLAAPLAGCIPELPDIIDDLVEYTPEQTEKESSLVTKAPASETPEATEAPTDEPGEDPTEAPTEAPTVCPVSEDGRYDSKDEVALYILLFGHLPDNYITKDEARALGWTGGSLEAYAPGCSIGGDRFGNYEGLLPKKAGRTYWECDIDTKGKSSRGAKRIVFSNDGLIFYTDDHYESFTLLYGEE